ncbi:putative PAP-specific phosphatase, mitochondrial isoform X2 [Phoenix dactylifera]|uniref:PAP-specific phosphatase, mitochondrial isoform X2 n=1 Tax=Phoenix dactylifera TaxID=42345 RepID=A0A8B7CB55_PHODC|nr:putative PAP-specific phosphatase, mitochondrial isoform X2 [Phoenix dactylifera]
MTLLHPSARLPVRRFGAPLLSPSSRAPSAPSFSLIRSSLPFPPEKARFHRELEAAVDVVERACRLCVDVKKSLLSSDGRILEKNDRTPVTVADFGVQALISLELKSLFPSIPLVAEEDSGFLRSNSVHAQRGEVHGANFLVDSVLSAVAEKTSSVDEPLTSDDVLEAIDRGGKDAVSFDAEPSAYWVLDPIDGTRGFLKGSDALYVVGLALVVKGEIAIGVMGCPNWKEYNLSTKKSDDKIGVSTPGIIMIAHSGCGTWTRRFSDVMGNYKRIQDGWRRCFVDSCCSSVDCGDIRDKQKVLLLPTCCGSLCKYLMVASGRASVFILRARAQTVIKVWDHAVGVVCVHEAGGKVTDWNGSPLDLAADQVDRRIIFPSGGVLVTNGALHKQLLEIISSNSSIA